MFLDIGTGILLSFFIGSAFGVDITPLWIILGIAFALLPDIDMIPYAIRTRILKQRVDDHRSFTHYPSIYIPIGFVIYCMFGAPYATLFALGVFFHFIHDSVWLGWGVSWLWPANNRKFKFFPDKDGKITNQRMLTWTKEEQEHIYKEYRSENWIRDFYFRPTIVSYTEYSIFIIGLIVLAYYFLGR